jgi:malate dehydrogenase (oxaloacetate-decarboxylating)
MEGKCVLLKEIGGVDAIQLCVRSKDVDEIVNCISLLGGGFGGINLEDIAAPRCFEIERKLKEKLDIPVFHDDQHGTAVVVGAAVTNALRLVNKKLSDCTVVFSGAGAAGIAIAKLIYQMGAGNIIMCDKMGVLCVGEDWMNPAQAQMAEITNKNHIKGTLADALKGADIFIGVSAPNIVTEEMIKSMGENAIVFPMANPTPEIMPELAKKAGARVVGTGRSDFPNQINNVLVFPGIFRGALDANATEITENMKLAAAKALAEHIKESELNEENIIPSALDKSIAFEVAKAVEKQAKIDGVIRK